ncbi:RNA polymerase sigma factor SigJ [Streptomyces sp. RFCAC02]|uniref:RNA polymerase sigma factor SigJ n=1 Tax=Streptomyces sp. RFCAC02 TaxID=2499143 RepID=UPI00102106E7|nr:RNA polymerase sigma factor SigJ [Streptomyces sp. RFCAC02]
MVDGRKSAGGAADAGVATRDPLAVFEAERGLLFAVAYRMLGRVGDAEDVVQECWPRWAAADHARIREPRAFLVRVVSRLALDRLRRIAALRETYVGSWLPEPLPADRARFPAEAPDGADRAMAAETVSYAVLVVMESLSPLERAVFVLREAFGLPHAEIAEALGRDEAAVRQLATRARRHMAERRPRYTVDPAEQRDLTRRFLAAAVEGDLAGLLALLAPDADLVTDRGRLGKGPVRVIAGADPVARFITGIAGRPPAGVAVGELACNGGSALLATLDGRPYSVFLLDTAGGLIRRIQLLSNPEKLTHLGAV